MIHPSIPFLIAGLLVLVVSPTLRKLIQLTTPIFAFCVLRFWTVEGSEVTYRTGFAGMEFTWIHTDGLALLFVYALLIFAWLANIYALHHPSKLLAFGANLYVGSAVGAVLAGDFITLFIFWELMAASSALLIWNPARQTSLPALFRYLCIHLIGGLLLFAGILIKGTSLLGPVPLDMAGCLIFLGFAVSAALPPLHAWLPDAYPEGTPSGSVYLSCFTTKVAIYAFARCFAGTEILIILGAATAIYGVVYALMENDIRRLLSYHIVCQVGYMLCGIGIGSAAGMNAGTAHAVGNILFKGLLFMATGAILYQTGTSKLSELGNFAKKNRLLLGFYMVGALAISGFPLLNGFVSKSMLLESAADAHLVWLEIVLLGVAVGTFLSIALKLAYFTFWGKASTSYNKVSPLPPNMNWAMALTSLLCLAIGIFPQILFQWLPYPNQVHPYTAGHVIGTLQMLGGTTLAFWWMLKTLHTKTLISLDTDWFYRQGAPLFIRGICTPLRRGQEWIQQQISRRIPLLHQTLQRTLVKPNNPPLEKPILWMVLGFLVVGLTMILF